MIEIQNFAFFALQLFLSVILFCPIIICPYNVELDLYCGDCTSLKVNSNELISTSTPCQVYQKTINNVDQNTPIIVEVQSRGTGGIGGTIKYGSKTYSIKDINVIECVGCTNDEITICTSIPLIGGIKNDGTIATYTFTIPILFYSIKTDLFYHKNNEKKDYTFDDFFKEIDNSAKGDIQNKPYFSITGNIEGTITTENGSPLSHMAKGEKITYTSSSQLTGYVDTFEIVLMFNNKPISVIGTINIAVCGQYCDKCEFTDNPLNKVLLNYCSDCKHDCFYVINLEQECYPKSDEDKGY